MVKSRIKGLKEQPFFRQRFAGGFSIHKTPKMSCAWKQQFPLNPFSKRVRGMFHMVEAIIGITFILTFLILMRSTIKPTEDTGLYQEYGYQALTVLDKRGVLRNNAMLENYTAIESELNAMLPAELTESVEICYAGSRCVGDALPGGTIYTSSYVIAGNATHFKPAEILLHMWRS